MTTLVEYDRFVVVTLLSGARKGIEKHRIFELTEIFPPAPETEDELPSDPYVVVEYTDNYGTAQNVRVSTTLDEILRQTNYASVGSVGQLQSLNG